MEKTSKFENSSVIFYSSQNVAPFVSIFISILILRRCEIFVAVRLLGIYFCESSFLSLFKIRLV